jgi:hypothetical protein
MTKEYGERKLMYQKDNGRTEERNDICVIFNNAVSCSVYNIVPVRDEYANEIILRCMYMTFTSNL